MNRTAVIIDGNGGIGSCLAHQFCSAGYQAIFTYHNNENAAWALESQNGVAAYQLDPTCEESVETFVPYIESNYKHLNALIYPAEYLKRPY